MADRILSVDSVTKLPPTSVLDALAAEIGGGGYAPPEGGIPKTDLASAVQTSLGKADTAAQPADLAAVTAAALVGDKYGRVGVRRSGAVFSGVPVSACSYVNAGNLITNSNASGITVRKTMRVVGPVSDIRVVAANWSHSPSGPVAPGNNIIVKAAIEYSGVTYPLTFKGSRTVTLEPWAQVESDPICIDFAQGGTFYLREHINTPSTGQQMPGGIVGTQSYVVNADSVDATGALGSAGASNIAFGCIGHVLGTPLGVRKPVVVAVGDSIVNGSNGSSQKDTVAGAGYVVRALNAGNVAGTLTAIGSVTAATFASVTGHLKAGQFWSLGTHGFIALGTNDLSTSPVAATIEAAIMTVARNLVDRGLAGSALATIIPRSSSTDSYATTANQTTHANDAVRLTINAWIRAGAPVDPSTLAPVAIGTSGALLAAVYDATGAPVTAGSGTGHPIIACLEVADTVESARDSGKWKVTGSANGYTSDGIHPGGNATADTAMAVPVSAWLASLTV